ncbi:MAG: sigma-70 family RNA polymerase sigma factor [Fimbriimonadaceae bacterium]|nr:sigma-70 family RNA polymerase sigma factor [Fimbriimonadaceae bacterium]QYK54689.1 MAG: sigma-70 family RNA polymerase sigma factor [Fimbriimonadaceae bacterium]
MSSELKVLYRVARRLGASAEEAEDLVQVTLVKAYQNWQRFDGRYIRSWLIRILRNERLATLRAVNLEVEWDDASENRAVEQPFWSGIETKLEAERIVAELETLPEIYRLAVQLCDVEQMSYEEAAIAMDVPIGTVRSRLFRARTELRKRLGGTLEP